jgi:hypothetical protein
MVLDESLQEFLGDRVARRDGLAKTLSQQRKDEYVASMSASRDAFGIDQLAQGFDSRNLGLDGGTPVGGGRDPRHGRTAALPQRF